MKKIFPIITILTLLIPLFSFAAEKEYGGIIYGPSFAFIIIAPKGWTLDTETGKRYKLPAVFYPKGSSFDGPLVMYINSVEKKNQKANNVNEFMQEEISRFKLKHPNIKITDGKALPIGNGRLTLVKEFSGDTWSNFEAVAYIEEEKTFTSFTLSSKKQEGYKKNFKAFKDLIAGYTFITDDVREK